MTFPQQSEELKNSTRDQLSMILALRKVRPLIGPPIVDLLRGVVTRVVDKKLEDFYSTMKCSTCRKRLTYSEPRTLELKFLDKIQTPVYTGRKIGGEGSTSIRLALVDCLTGAVVRSGCEATASFELVVLKGESTGEGGDNLTVENFDSKIVETQRGKKSLLKGHSRLKLREGICDLGEVSFIHNSGWMKISKLCLAARVLDSFSGTTIKPAKTEDFVLKDCRNTLYGKKYPPALCDEVWRLKKIDKRGDIRKHLNREKIESVEDFLKLLYMEPERLQKILHAGAKTWEVITEHAKTCIIDENEQFSYHPNPQQRDGVVFNVVGQLKGILREAEYVPLDKLSEKEKENANNLVICAFRDGEELTPYNNDTSRVETCPLFPESTTPNDDKMDLLRQYFDHPIHSPETAYHNIDYHRLPFLSNNSQSVPQTDQTPPGILLVDSRDVSTTANIKKRWRSLFVLLNVILTVKSFGDPESVRALKKQRVA